MRRRLIPALLLALTTLGPARAATTVYPAATISLSPTEKVSIQLTVETGTFSVDGMVFVRKFCYTLKNLSGNGYRVSGFNPSCDNPFGVDPAIVTPASKSAGWQAAHFPLDSPADYVWLTLTGQNTSALGNGESVKVALYTNDPPGVGDMFLRGLAPGSGATRHDALRYWHPDCGGGIEVPKNGPPVVPHGPFDLPQAYPAKPGVYTGSSPAIAPNNCFSGTQTGPSNANAVSGVLCLDTVDVDGLPVLNVALFATCPPGQIDPYVQSYRLIKTVPGSDKCPLTYSPKTFAQYGTGIRTWWALRYTQPGTTFTLEVTVRCRDLTRGGAAALHVDRWTWRVVATLETLPHVIDVLHTRAIGTLEIPCIAGEDAYRALLAGTNRLKTAAAKPLRSGRARAELQDALFDLEALLLANGAFGEVVTTQGWFATFPPGNKTELGQMGYAGILESLENPCVCKLIADLEYIGTQLGIVS